VAKDRAYYERLARAIAQQEGIDPGVFTRQISAESGFNPEARSGAGAMGIAQIVPKWHPGVDPMDPEAALRYAAKHDASLLKKYKGDWREVLSVYNSGRPGKWADPNFAGGETFNYVKKILNGQAPEAADTPAPSSAPVTPHEEMAAPALNAMQSALFSNLLGQNEAYAKGEDNSGSTGLSSLLSTLSQSVSRQAPQRSTPSPAQALAAAQGGAQQGPGVLKRGGLAEAFYDPLGSFDNGAFGGAIGNHDDHVHGSFSDPQTTLAAIKRAQQMGLSVRENPYTDKVDPVHTEGSFHYRNFPGQFDGKTLGQGIDVSGEADQMSNFFKWLTAAYR
jgi:hypothetical protein